MSICTLLIFLSISVSVSVSVSDGAGYLALMSGLGDRSAQGPGVYAVQALAAQRDAVVVHGGRLSGGAARPVATGLGNHASDVFMSGESARWSQCQEVAPPRIRNPAEVREAFEDFKKRFPVSRSCSSPDGLRHCLRFCLGGSRGEMARYHSRDGDRTMTML